MSQKHVSNYEAYNNFTEAFNRVVNNGDNPKWMAVVFSVVDKKVVMDQRTTFQFPTGLMGAAVGELSLDVARELDKKEEPEIPEPLPEAELAWIGAGKWVDPNEQKEEENGGDT